MANQIHGAYLTIDENLTIKVSDITSIKPRTIVKYNEYTGAIIARDFSKVILKTNRDEFEVLYATDEERDEALKDIRNLVMEYSSKLETMKKENYTHINVTKSSNINIISQSSNVAINQETKTDIYSKIEELVQKLEEIKEIDIDSKNDIYDCINDIKDNIDNNKKVPKYCLSGLLDLTSKVASLSSLGIGIAQLLGA